MSRTDATPALIDVARDTFSQTWMRHAACLPNDPDPDKDPTAPWFAAPLDGQAETAAAVAICQGCPVREPCLEAAMAVEGKKCRGGRHGVFGGLTGPQRHKLYVAERRSAA